MTYTAAQMADLLQDMGPDEIRARYGTELDAGARRALADAEEALVDVDALLVEAGACFRRRVAAPPLRPVVPARRPCTVPVAVAAALAAALLALAVLIPRGAETNEGARDPVGGMRAVLRPPALADDYRRAYDDLVALGAALIKAANAETDAETAAAQRAEALAHLTYAHHLAPDDSRALLYLHDLCRALGRPKEAEAYKRRYLETQTPP